MEFHKKAIIFIYIGKLTALSSSRNNLPGSLNIQAEEGAMLSLRLSPELERWISVRISKSHQKGACDLRGHGSPVVRTHLVITGICPVANVAVNLI